jgi:hypothetical protein
MRSGRFSRITRTGKDKRPTILLDPIFQDLRTERASVPGAAPFSNKSLARIRKTTRHNRF